MDMEIAKALTNGGRALDAVWDLPGFTPHEKLFLLYLGSQLDFGSEMVGLHPLRRIEVVADKIGIGEGTLYHVVDSLVRRRYIELNENSTKSGNLIMTDSYVLTEKIWRDYADLLHSRRAQYSRRLPELP